jgi:hypothetical protein
MRQRETWPHPCLLSLLGGKLLPILPSPENAWASPLCAIVERAISPYPELRYRSAIELSNALGVPVGPPRDNSESRLPTEAFNREQPKQRHERHERVPKLGSHACP